MTTKCAKVVKGTKSLCCAIRRHWVHQRCIGTCITNKYKNELKTFLEYYKDKDWYCNGCTEDTFPFLKMTDTESVLLTSML